MYHIITSILEYNENSPILVYRGIGDKVNYTYGGSDNGMGTFYTDNIIMAKWFAGLIEYNPEIEDYEKTSNSGKLISKKINFKKPYIINSDNEDYDSFQLYMDEIKYSGGVKKYKNILLNKKHDGIILKNNNTNYYKEGNYNIYIIF